jgi:4-hydroxymandelate oxidase
VPPADPPDLARIVSLAEFEPLARAAMEPEAYDYAAGGSWDELSLADNVAAWRRRRLRPRVLVDVTGVSAATTILGTPSALPLAIAPVAGQATADPEGEIAMARAAAAAGVPLILSSFSSRTPEAVATGAPAATLWFQLYVLPELARTRAVVERAAAAGYGAIVLTVDLPIPGYRERELRAPGWDFPRDEPEPFDLDFDPVRLTWDDLAEIRSWAPGLPLVLKGIMCAEDARLAVEHGVDAIVVSNHGARQLDRVAASVDMLEEVVAAVAGRTEVWVDGGVRRGLDVVIALALGARAVLLGRPALWALAAGGQAGVERALTIMREEVEIALALLGTPRPDAVTRAHSR